MKILLLCICPWLLTGYMTSCTTPHEAIPVTFGVCKDGTCLNVGVTIPARKSGKEVVEVQ